MPTGLNAAIFNHAVNHFVPAEACKQEGHGIDHSINIIGYGYDDENGPYWCDPFTRLPHEL